MAGRLGRWMVYGVLCWGAGLGCGGGASRPSDSATPGDTIEPPRVETPATPLPKPVWSQHFGAEGRELLTALATTGRGNLILGATLQEPVDFTGSVLGTSGPDQFALVELAPPDRTWAGAAFQPGAEGIAGSPTHLVARPGGGVLATVELSTTDFGAGVPKDRPYGRNVLVSLSATLSVEWARNLEGLETLGLTLGPHGEVALVTSPSGTVGNTECTQLWVFTREGVLLWSRPLEGNDATIRGMLAMTPAFMDSGDLLLVGLAVGSFEMDGQRVEGSSLSTPVAVVLRGSDGHFLKAFVLNGATGGLTQLARAADGSFRALGYVDRGAAAQWGTSPIVSPPGDAQDPVVLALSSDGTPLWGRVLRGFEGFFGERVATGGQDTLVAITYMSPHVTSCTQASVLRLDENGTEQWRQDLATRCDKSPDAPQGIEITGLGVQPDGTLVVGGHFKGRLPLGETVLKSQGDGLIDYDLFVAGYR